MAQVPRIGQPSSAGAVTVGGRPAAGRANIANAERAEVEEISVETSVGDLPSSLSFNQYTVLPPTKKQGRTESFGALFSNILGGFSALIDAQTEFSESKSASGRAQGTRHQDEIAFGVRLYEANLINRAQNLNQMGSVKILV